MGALQRRPSGLQRAFQDVSGDLIIIGSKMRSIIDSMVEYMSYPEHQDSHLDGLVAVLEDLVADVERLGSESDRTAWAKVGKPPSAGPSVTAAAA